MPKVRKAELSFLYTTCCLVLFYISTKYHLNIPKSILVTERTRNLLQIKQRVITSKIRKPELSILYATHHLVLIFISTKYHQNISKGILVTEPTRSFTLTLMPMGYIPKTICPSPPFGRGGHNWPFGSGEEAQNRFSRWLPWWPSWISDWKDLSYF